MKRKTKERERDFLISVSFHFILFCFFLFCASHLSIPLSSHSPSPFFFFLCALPYLPSSLSLPHTLLAASSSNHPSVFLILNCKLFRQLLFSMDSGRKRPPLFFKKERKGGILAQATRYPAPTDRRKEKEGNLTTTMVFCTRAGKGKHARRC